MPGPALPELPRYGQRITIERLRLGDRGANRDRRYRSNDAKEAEKSAPGKSFAAAALGVHFTLYPRPSRHAAIAR